MASVSSPVAVPEEIKTPNSTNNSNGTPATASATGENADNTKSIDGASQLQGGGRISLVRYHVTGFGEWQGVPFNPTCE
jgi:hypothetical protein